jgi:hypothetical protein
VNKPPSGPQSLPSDEEYQRFAEQFVDAVLDPRQPWLVQYLKVFGFPPVPTEEQIASGALAAKMRSAIEGSSSFFVDEWIYEGLTKPDRQLILTATCWWFGNLLECLLARWLYSH